MKTNIREITSLTLTSEHLAKVSEHDRKTLARGNRALKKAHATSDVLSFANAARAFSELGIHFQVYGC